MLDVRGFARDMGGAFYECNPFDPSWTWRLKKIKISEFLRNPLVVGGRHTKSMWLDFYEDEQKNSEIYGGDTMSRMEADLIAEPDTFEPIVIAILENGYIDIGDGWHRIACAIKAGIPELTAVVGTKAGDYGPGTLFRSHQ